MTPVSAAAGEFCWFDLATTDPASARAFYRRMFGWTAHEQVANGGRFTRLRRDGRDVASLYQLPPRNAGVTSHWLPYLRVDDINRAVRMTTQCGGDIAVRPFMVEGVARIAVILDATGAPVGLWEQLSPASGATGRG